MSVRTRGLFVVAMLATAALGSGCSSCSDKHAATLDAAAAQPIHTDAGDASAANDPDGGALDDTAMPATGGEDLQARMRHLLEAVTQNNPDLAGDALFPRDGYILARDAPDPQAAWDRHVSGMFRKSVERTHKRMKGIEHAKFVSFELGHSIMQLTPKKKDFKKALWRVKHSKLSFTIDGKMRHLDIVEMTAWRGAWYVTRLR
jgi:hypothetical protein